MNDTNNPPSRKDIQLRHGYGLAEGGPLRDTLQLVAPDGRVCVTIQLRPEGPVVEVAAASLRVAAEGDLTVDCNRFQVHARDQIALVSGGEIATDAEGNVITRSDGEIVTEAAGQQHRARLGSVDITANDDVTLYGERILLNEPQVLPAPPIDLPRREIAHRAVAAENDGEQRSPK